MNKQAYTLPVRIPRHGNVEHFAILAWQADSNLCIPINIHSQITAFTPGGCHTHRWTLINSQHTIHDYKKEE